MNTTWRSTAIRRIRNRHCNMDFAEIYKNRYAVRSFSGAKPEKEKLERILDAVRLSPTALNHQPYQIYVAQTEDGLEKVKRALAPDYGQPIVFIVCSERNNTWQNRYSGQDNVLQDIGIIGATILYAAKNEGLGSCYVCNFDPKILQNELNLGVETIPECLIFIGYPSENASPSERHSIRRATEEFVTFI